MVSADALQGAHVIEAWHLLRHTLTHRISLP